jgi:hypothetical protein
MKTKATILTRRDTDADLPPEEIHLPPTESRRLESAIPFHHAPDEQERQEPVAGDAPRTGPPRRKWHEDHDAVLTDAGYDTDVLLVERHDAARAIDTPL